jgi:hypothetical protein
LEVEEMKIWITLHYNGVVKNVYLTEEEAKGSMGPDDYLLEKEIKLTYTANRIIKELAQELS